MRVRGPQHDAVADAKAAWGRERDLLVVPIRVVLQGDRLRGDLGNDRIGAAAPQTQLGRQKDGVAERKRAWQQLDRAAAQSGHVVHGGLNDLVVAADQVGLVRPDGDRQPLGPVRLVNLVTVRGSGIGDARHLAAPQSLGSRPAG